MTIFSYVNISIKLHAIFTYLPTSQVVQMSRSLNVKIPLKTVENLNSNFLNTAKTVKNSEILFR
jgi:hypothetical protein